MLNMTFQKIYKMTKKKKKEKEEKDDSRFLTGNQVSRKCNIFKVPKGKTINLKFYTQQKCHSKTKAKILFQTYQSLRNVSPADPPVTFLKELLQVKKKWKYGSTQKKEKPKMVNTWINVNNSF